MKRIVTIALLGLALSGVATSAQAGGIGDIGRRVEKHIRKTIAEREKAARRGLAKGEVRVRKGLKAAEERVRDSAAKAEKKLRKWVKRW